MKFLLSTLGSVSNNIYLRTCLWSKIKHPVFQRSDLVHIGMHQAPFSLSSSVKPLNSVVVCMQDKNQQRFFRPVRAQEFCGGSLQTVTGAKIRKFYLHWVSVISRQAHSQLAGKSLNGLILGFVSVLIIMYLMSKY